MLTFQQLIHRLSEFWEKKGCIIHQGHDLEVGAGTFNPATFLRCLGPEPYRTAYVEPSRRPQDGRYGENPNRVQLFHQYQVILKPSPKDVQKLYLESLEAIGLKLKSHDIRFVHSDWESPSLGAWGLGWEVWCDGMEVSQFTYFQAIASLPLHPISAEITYGLERLAMYVQNVDKLFDVKWNDTLTIGDISKRSEVEWSMYNFEEASTSMWLDHFNDFEKEAKKLISRHLPIPAYDFVVKASHAFNILDARGVISVTERTGYIARLRDLARLVGIEYVAIREKEGFPLLAKEKKKEKKQIALPKLSLAFNPKKKRDFLLEIGSEELPATFVPVGCRNLENALVELLEAHALSYEKLEVYGSARRLAIYVQGVVEGTEDKSVEKKGPPISFAFDAAGKPTPQGAGFLKSLGCPPYSLAEIQQGKAKGLQIVRIKESDYLFANLKEKGQSTAQILSQQLPELILQLEFPKKMRWGSLDISYARPLHWIVALFGDKILPFQVGDVTSNRFSFGHAQRSPKKITLKNGKDYLGALKKGHVLASQKERRSTIEKQIAAFEKKNKCQLLEKDSVIKEVLYLCEWPQLTHASFDTRFLKAPQEILISEMVEHQKYFPVADLKGRLKNQFVITADNTPSELIRKGNQKVLSARLYDGVFLYEQDLKIPLEKFNEKLALMTFQKELGSMLDKVMRLSSHAKVLNEALSIADEKNLLRAALLCKSDLASNLVGEFPDLQGTIGRYYALAQNEEREVADAIQEHWMPIREEASLPQTPAGKVLSLADKLDNLLGYWSVGLIPTSSSDPYALRRQTFGLIKILVDGEHTLNLKTLLEECSLTFPLLKNDSKKRQTAIEGILHFVTSRAKSLFEDYGFKKDEIDAALQGICLDPYDQFCKVKALHAFRKQGNEFTKLFEVYKRAKGQLEKPAEAIFNPSLAKESAEKELVHQLDILHKHWKETLADRDYVKAFSHIAKLQPYLAKLFDTVKIMADDAHIRANRIALLQKVFSYFEELLDFGKIQEMR